MIRHGNPPYLECSSRGDRRFSAFYAKVDGLSIESRYQSAKVFDDDGRRVINYQEARDLYSRLWDRYIAEHPELVEVLAEATGLSDMFGKEGHACQATELWRIKQLLEVAAQ